MALSTNPNRAEIALGDLDIKILFVGDFCEPRRALWRCPSRNRISVPVSGGFQMRVFRIGAAVFFALASSAHAQETVKQSEIEFYVQSSGGVAQSCGMEFTILYTDRTYRNGDPAAVKGSLAWVEGNGNFAVALIIKAYDINATMTPIPFPVYQGFVITEGKSILPSVTTKCDQPTDFCGLYSFQNTMAITDAVIGKKRLTIGFNREAKGGIDTTLPIKIVPSANFERFLNFSDCMITLADRAKANAK